MKKDILRSGKMLVSLNTELNSALARVWFQSKFLERRSAIPLLLFFGASVFKSYTLLLSETEHDTKQEQVQTPKQKKTFDTKRRDEKLQQRRWLKWTDSVAENVCDWRIKNSLQVTKCQPYRYLSRLAAGRVSFSFPAYQEAIFRALCHLKGTKKIENDQGPMKESCFFLIDHTWRLLWM